MTLNKSNLKMLRVFIYGIPYNHSTHLNFTNDSLERYNLFKSKITDNPDLDEVTLDTNEIRLATLLITHFLEDMCDKDEMTTITGYEGDEIKELLMLLIKDKDFFSVCTIHKR
jgi:hypothetical protein